MSNNESLPPTSPKPSQSQALSAVPTLDNSPSFNSSEIGESSGRRFSLPVMIGGGVLAVLLISGLVYGIFGGGSDDHPELLLHTVKLEDVDLTVIERGAVESSDNRDIICKVKAGAKGNYATTIKWVIDDGTIVRRGQSIMILDSSSLEEQFRNQKIVVETKHAEWVAAESAYKIMLSTNESAVEKARSDIQLRELDLEMYVGLPKGTLSGRKREESRNLLLSMESNLESFMARSKGEFPQLQGEFHKLLNDVVGQIELARADVEMWNDRLAYSRRMELKGYLSPAQVQADESRMVGSRETLKKLETDQLLLQRFLSQKSVKEASALVQEAWRAFDRAVSEAEANEIKAEADRRTKRSVYLQEEDKLREIEEQLRECKIFAPQDGMVVYYMPESSRWSQSERGLIQQGATVQEGQKMMRIPDLTKMQVSTKVHEAMVSRIKGDHRLSTGIHESIIAGLSLTPRPMTAILPLHEQMLELQRDVYRSQEYYEASRGQPAMLRIDAFPEKPLRGHVKTVATVASADNWLSSDVKVYSTVVAIDETLPGLKPGMSAEVTIHVNKTLQNVLAIPVQAVIGGAESGRTRKVFVMTANGPEEREIQIGLSNEKMAEVQSGLQAGDQVVVNPKAIVGNTMKTREEGAQQGTKGKGKGKGPAGGASSKGGKKK